MYAYIEFSKHSLKLSSITRISNFFFLNHRDINIIILPQVSKRVGSSIRHSPSTQKRYAFAIHPVYYNNTIYIIIIPRDSPRQSHRACRRRHRFSGCLYNPAGWFTKSPSLTRREYIECHTLYAVALFSVTDACACVLFAYPQVTPGRAGRLIPICNI